MRFFSCLRYLPRGNFGFRTGVGADLKPGLYVGTKLRRRHPAEPGGGILTLRPSQLCPAPEHSTSGLAGRLAKFTLAAIEE
jgi:hypothetical protein